MTSVWGGNSIGKEIRLDGLRSASKDGKRVRPKLIGVSRTRGSLKQETSALSGIKIVEVLVNARRRAKHDITVANKYGAAWPKVENTMLFRLNNRALPENGVWAPESHHVKSLAPWLRERQKWHAVFSCAGALKTSRANL